MAKISMIEQYKFRVKYLRQFVDHFDAKHGYKLNKLKYIESEVSRDRTPKRALAFLKATPRDQILSRDQTILIDKYFAYVFPPKTFIANMKMIRKYTNGFTAKDGFDLRNFLNASRPKLKKAVEMIRLVTDLKKRPHIVVKRYKGERLRKLQLAAQHSEFPPELKVAFVPANKNLPLDIKFLKNGIVVFNQVGTKKYTSMFDMRGLMLEPENEIRRAFDMLPPDNYANYNILANEFEVYKVQKGSGATRSASLKGLTQKALFYMNKYSAESYDPDDPNSHFYGNWLTGMVAYKSDERKHLMNYMSHLDKLRVIGKMERKEINKEKEKKRRRAQKIIQTRNKKLKTKAKTKPRKK